MCGHIIQLNGKFYIGIRFIIKAKDIQLVSNKQWAACNSLQSIEQQIIGL